MKANKIMALAAVAALTLSMTALSTASAKGQGFNQEGWACHGGRGEAKQLKRMLRGLDLTDEQKQQVKGILEQARAERPQRDVAAIQAQMDRRHQLMMADQFDEQAARTLIAERQVKMAEMQLAQMQLKHEIFQLLTDEQKLALEQRRAERMKRMEDRF